MAHNIFISHSFQDATLHHQLVGELLKRKPRIDFQDLSVPRTQLIQSPRPKVLIGKRIRQCKVLFAFTRPIASKSPFILFELETANRHNIPIIAVRPEGDRNVSRVVRERANMIIDWNLDQIVWHIRYPGKLSKSKASPQDSVVVDDYANADEPEGDKSFDEVFVEVKPRLSLRDTLRRAFGFGRSDVAPATSVSQQKISRPTLKRS